MDEESSVCVCSPNIQVTRILYNPKEKCLTVTTEILKTRSDTLKLTSPNQVHTFYESNLIISLLDILSPPQNPDYIVSWDLPHRNYCVVLVHPSKF